MLLAEILCLHGEVSLHMKYRDYSYGGMIVGVRIFKVKTADPAVNHISVCSSS